MLNVTKSLGRAGPLYQRLLKDNFVLLFAYGVLASLLCMGVEAYFSKGESNLGNVALQISMGLSQLLTDVALILLLSWMLLNHLKTPTSFKTFLDRKLNLLVAESLRAITSVLLWTLALILPGLYKYVLYVFISYIVVFDEDYEQGKADALKLSSQLTLSSFFKVLFTIILTGLITFGIEIGPRSLGFTGFFPDLILSMIGYLFSGFCFVLFYEYYISLKLNLKGKD